MTDNAGHVLNLEGESNSITTLTSGTATVNYTRSGGNQELMAHTYANLGIANGGTKTLLDNITVNNSLILNSGLLEIGNFDLLMLNAATIGGTPGPGSMVQTSGTGSFIKRTNTTNVNQTFLFPVGSGGNYAPASLNLTALASANPTTSHVALRTVAGKHPDLLDPADSALERHWLTSSNQLSNLTGNWVFTYPTSEADPLEENNYLGGYYPNALPWNYYNSTVNTTDKTITFNYSALTNLNAGWTAAVIDAYSPAYYSIDSGNWENAASWSTQGYGGTPAASIPQVGSRVFIGDGKTITITANTAKVLNELQIDATGILNTATFANSLSVMLFSDQGTGGNGRLRIGNAAFPNVTINNFLDNEGTGRSTVEYFGAGYTLPNIPSNPDTYQNLEITGTGTKALTNAATANMLVKGSFLIANGATFNPDQRNMTVEGPSTIAGTLADGNAAGLSTFQNVNLSGGIISAGANGNILIQGNLTMPTGDATIGRAVVTVEGTTTIPSLRTLTLNNVNGAKTFNNIVLTGIWNSTVNQPYTITGSLTVNPGAVLTSGTGIYSFNGDNHQINGNGTFIISNVTINGTYTNNAPNFSIATNATIARNGKLTNNAGFIPTQHLVYNDVVTPIFTRGYDRQRVSDNAGNSVVSAGGRNYRLTRNGAGSVYALKTTDFNPTNLGVLLVRFDLSVTSTGTNNNSARLIVGNNLTDDDVVNAGTALLNINLQAAANYTVGTSGNYNASQLISWVINNTGTAVQVPAPNNTGSVNIPANQAAYWVGNTFVGTIANANPGQAMNDFKVVFNNSAAGVNVINLNNLFISPIATITPTLTLATGPGSCGPGTLAITAGPNSPSRTFVVNYTVAGATATTHYPADNVFSVQLSNATGSFASPTVIGTLASTALSGSITATVPDGQGEGNNYRIRVVSSNPVSAAIDNGQAIRIYRTASTISVAPLTQQILLSQPGVVGSPVTATLANVPAFGSTSDVIWGYRTTSGGPITFFSPARTGNTFTPAGLDFPQRGTYYLVAVSNCGSSVVSQEITIFINCPSGIGNPNLVVNGNFESGTFNASLPDRGLSSFGFTSAPTYQFVPDNGMGTNNMFPENTFAVSNNPRHHHTNFCNVFDPAFPAIPAGGPSGRMLVVNGATTANTILWQQFIPVLEPYTDYIFSIWVLNLNDLRSNFIFSTDCGQVGQPINFDLNDGCSKGWRQFAVQWNSGNKTSITLALRNATAIAAGQDLAFDNIEFYKCEGTAVFPNLFIWNGGNYAGSSGASTDWFNGDNWGNCSAPTCDDDVVIPAVAAGFSYPVINAANARARKVTIQNNARITINTGFNLDVCGDMEVNGTGRINAVAGSVISFVGDNALQRIYGTGSYVGTNNDFGSIVVNKANAAQELRFDLNFDVAGSLTITRGTFDLNGRTMQIGGDITNNSNFASNNGLVRFAGATNPQIISGNFTNTNRFHHVEVNKTNTADRVNLATNVDIGGNLTVTRGTLHGNTGNYLLRMFGTNLAVQANGIFNRGNSTVSFTGASEQFYNNTSSTAANAGTGVNVFFNLAMNQAANNHLRLVASPGNQVQVTNQLLLNSGRIWVGVNPAAQITLFATNTAANAVATGNTDSYVITMPEDPSRRLLLRRNITGTNVYDFPVGDEVNYQLARVTVNSTLVGVSHITSFFSGVNQDGEFDAGTCKYIPCGGGYWELTPNMQPTAGNYAMRLFPVGFSCTATLCPRSIAKGPTYGFAGSTTTANTYERTGFTNFSPFVPVEEKNIPTPVEFLFVEAVKKGNSALVRWATVWERANDFFTVQRSIDGKNWRNLGKVKGMGNSQTRTDYQLADEMPADGFNYYRIEQTDLDGTISYSNIVSLHYESDELRPDLVIYPNPARGLAFNLFIASMENVSTIQVEISDVLGRKIYQTRRDYYGDVISISEPDMQLAKGVYFVKVTAGTKKYQEKLMIE